MDRIFCDDCGHESTAHLDGCTVRSCTCRALVKRSHAPTPRRDIGTCKECRFFAQDSKDRRLPAPAMRMMLGTCRRYAPDGPSLLGEEWRSTEWPIVRNEDWCGEFERRDPK